MKCVDCKFCAFINKGSEEMIIKSSGVQALWYAVEGAYCMKTSCIIAGVEDCSGYEKSQHKKMKILV